MTDYEPPTDAELAAIKVNNWTGEQYQVEDLMHARFINDMEAAGVLVPVSGSADQLAPCALSQGAFDLLQASMEAVKILSSRDQSEEEYKKTYQRLKIS